MRHAVLIAFALLLLPACGNSSQARGNASVTVKVPPAKPYVPQPSFSFGSAPRTPR